MTESAALAIILIAGLLLGAGFVYGIPWLLLLGLIVMPAAFPFGITGRPSSQVTARPDPELADPERIPHPSADPQVASPCDGTAKRNDREETT